MGASISKNITKKDAKIQHYQWIVDGDWERLDQFLIHKLESETGQVFSRSRMRTLIQAGAVTVGGQRARGSAQSLRDGVKIHASVRLDLLLEKSPGTQNSPSHPFGLHSIVYRDEWIVVVNKPSGLPTQPTLDPLRPNLFDELKKLLKAEGIDYVGLHHRLDRDTSGLVVFTVSKKANAGIAEAFATHQIQKTYEALCLGKPPSKEWTVDNFLRKESGGKAAKMRSVFSGGDRAITQFKWILSGKTGKQLAFKVEAQPKTGRMHQIRVHLSEGHTPILGDAQYGGPALAEFAPRVMLHAKRLRLRHPVLGDERIFEAETPPDFVLFESGLKTSG